VQAAPAPAPAFLQPQAPMGMPPFMNVQPQAPMSMPPFMIMNVQ
jgi:hypothetical protein